MLSLVGGVLLSLAIILLAARLGGRAAARFGQPTVLGELVAGVAVGNVATLAGIASPVFLGENVWIDRFAQLGAILLLFEVGLESSIPQMLKVGLSSVLVATFGVVGPFVLGWLVSAWFLPEASVYTHVFIGGILTATSIGITARVLKDLGKSQSVEGRLILGAAVIDDVEGLVLLAVVSGLVGAANTGGSLSYGAIGLIVIKAAAFLVGGLVIGARLAPGLLLLASRSGSRFVRVIVALGFCLVLSWLAAVIGLAPIVGAFAAGLVLETPADVRHAGERSIGEVIRPLASFLVPVFFVVMGIRTDLRALAEPGVLWLAMALTAAAVLGKQLCALGVIGKGIDRLSINIGMIPRGEVGLIFANVGLSLAIAGQAVIDRRAFAAIVVMVMVTTMMTPPALKWSFGRQGKFRIQNSEF